LTSGYDKEDENFICYVDLILSVGQDDGEFRECDEFDFKIIFSNSDTELEAIILATNYVAKNMKSKDK